MRRVHYILEKQDGTVYARYYSKNIAKRIAKDAIQMGTSIKLIKTITITEEIPIHEQPRRERVLPRSNPCRDLLQEGYTPRTRSDSWHTVQAARRTLEEDPRRNLPSGIDPVESVRVRIDSDTARQLNELRRSYDRHQEETISRWARETLEGTRSGHSLTALLYGRGYGPTPNPMGDSVGVVDPSAA